jgi:hypothetical protein
VRADSGDDNTDAFQIKGSFGFADKYHVQAKYYDGENGDVGNNGEDFDGYEIRLGINPAVTDNTDFVFQVGYMDMSQERGSNAIAGSLKDVDSDGYILTVGLRSMLTDQLEISGYVDSIAGEQDEYLTTALGVPTNVGKSTPDYTDIVLRVGGVYNFTDNLGLSIEYEDGDESAATFGARWSF